MTRPTCEHIIRDGTLCSNLATKVNIKADGSHQCRRSNGKYTCWSHHFRNTTNLRPQDMYKKSRKHYCENIDGRLGKICTANITCDAELTVDRIDGDHSNNDPSNWQTLCASCHNLKTKQDHANNGTCLHREKIGTPLENRHPHLFGP